ncbi:hypothetical protein [Tardibacter chloracetimidivorans]|uniref:hypothetical protein n=1 Tax=Tardibacter chloracetimidivorans TaxID=1921510 RepID=UPI0013015922|nr:hypothetical protein [Tardibacter chloracetimidivorans]
MFRLVFFALAALPSMVYAQTTGQRFDLHCTGKRFVGDFKDLSDKSKYLNTTIRYKVDLDSGLWCSGACIETNSIFSVSHTKIVLLFEETDDLEQVVFVNRETGALLDRMRLLPYLVMTTASCAPSAFTGFPARKF